MNFTSRLFFAGTATTAGTAVAVSTAVITAAFAVKRTIVVQRSFLGSCAMSLQFDLSFVLETLLLLRLCSSAGSRPDAGRGFSFSSPSFFYGYQNRACSYIL